MLKRVRIEIDLDLELDSDIISDEILDYLVHKYVNDSLYIMCKDNDIEYGGAVTSINIENN